MLAPAEGSRTGNRLDYACAVHTYLLNSGEGCFAQLLTHQMSPGPAGPDGCGEGKQKGKPQIKCMPCALDGLMQDGPPSRESKAVPSADVTGHWPSRAHAIIQPRLASCRCLEEICSVLRTLGGGVTCEERHVRENRKSGDSSKLGPRYQLSALPPDRPSLGCSLVVVAP